VRDGGAEVLDCERNALLIECLSSEMVSYYNAFIMFKVVCGLSWYMVVEW
jgi:hypothetical protein